MGGGETFPLPWKSFTIISTPDSINVSADGNHISPYPFSLVVMRCSQLSSTDNLPYLALIIVVVAVVGVFAFAGVCLWRKRKSRRIDCVKYGKVVMNCLQIVQDSYLACCHCTVRTCTLSPHTEPVGLLQVTDALNRNGVKIISVQGNCVSAECDPCHCNRGATTVDIYGTFNEKTFVMTFLKSDEDNMERLIAELLQQKSNLFADYCFALWAGGSVPRKVQLQFKKVLEWRKESCAVLPVQGFPWKVGSKDEKRVVQLFKTSHLSLSIKVTSFRCWREATHVVMLFCVHRLKLQVDKKHKLLQQRVGKSLAPIHIQTLLNLMLSN